MEIQTTCRIVLKGGIVQVIPELTDVQRKKLSRYPVKCEIVAPENEQRDLTDEEIRKHLNSLKEYKDTVLEFNDAVRILKELKEDFGDDGMWRFNTVSTQLSVLTHPTNPIFVYDRVGRNLPKWYADKYTK